MMAGIADPHPEAAFVLGMIPHHQGAIDMAEIVLRYGEDETLHRLARHIIEVQEQEIEAMRAWLRQRNLPQPRSEEHTSELQSLMRISYAVFCLKKKKTETTQI